VEAAVGGAAAGEDSADSAVAGEAADSADSVVVEDLVAAVVAPAGKEDRID
jgi:hypothetical protein